jgi:hypothetical protein
MLFNRGPYYLNVPHILLGPKTFVGANVEMQQNVSHHTLLYILITIGGDWGGGGFVVICISESVLVLY